MMIRKLETIRFARSLDTSVAQFSILTPYPGTVLFEKLKDRLRHTKWSLYDGTHLVFKHEHVSYVQMQLLLLWAYVSYYARGWRAMRGFLKAFVRNTPVLKLYWGKANQQL
jgi:anaerobic magnesium-protoporphyrin IX monomethyl ester cyclase